MPRFQTHPRRWLALAVFLLLVLSLLPARWAGVLSRSPRHVVEFLVTPISHPTRSLLLRFVGQPMRDDGLTADQLRRQRDEYHRLAYKLQLQLDEERARNQQFAQLGRLFGDIGSQTLVNASVVASSANYRHPSLRLNRGSREGLDVQDVVVHGIHLVGRVVDVGPVSSTVSLITAPRTSLMVRFAPPGPAVPRHVEAIVEVAPDGRSFIGVVDANRPVEEGDIAFLADNKWPREGFIVGKVTSVAVSPSDPLRRIVMIEPDVPLLSLSYVTVLVSDVDPVLP